MQPSTLITLLTATTPLTSISAALAAASAALPSPLPSAWCDRQGRCKGQTLQTPRTGSCSRTVSRLQPYVLAVTLAAISVPRRSLSSATGRLPSLCLVMLEAYCASAWLRCCRKVTHSSCSSRLGQG